MPNSDDVTFSANIEHRQGVEQILSVTCSPFFTAVKIESGIEPLRDIGKDEYMVEIDLSMPSKFRTLTLQLLDEHAQTTIFGDRVTIQSHLRRFSLVIRRNHYAASPSLALVIHDADYYGENNIKFPRGTIEYYQAIYLVDLFMLLKDDAEEKNNASTESE